MSDSNRLRVSIVKETTFGTTPAGPGMQVLQVTGQSLRDRVGYQQSNIINDDRNVEELVRLSKSAAGQTPIELMFSPSGEALELLLGATMCSAETPESEDTGASIVSTGKVITCALGTNNADVSVGDIVATTGATAGYYKVTAVTTTTITVEADSDFEAEDPITVTRAARRTNGTVNDSFTIEVARLDLQKAQIFTGCTVNMLDVTIADEAMVTANLTFEAATSTFATTNTGTDDQFIAAATYTDATAHPVLDSLSIPEIRSAGTSFAAKQITLNINNNVVARTELGKLGAQSMRQGEFNVTGSFDAYFEDFSEMQAYADNTAGAIWFALIDANGRGYSFSLPTVKFSDAGADVTGSNTDTMVSVSYQATLDSDEDITLRMQRWA
tara:strand:+ start:7014 stop:8168 length:1155 start_codon:yes stop_codon:yes gene_type:complete